MSKLIILVLLAILLFVSEAHAAYFDEDYVVDLQPRWDLRAGLAWPSGETVDSSELIVGVEYEHPLRSSPGYLTLSLDYTAITSQRVENDVVVQDNVTLLPVLINYKRDSTAEGVPVYFAFGLGFYWAQDPIPEMRLDDGISFAWQLMAGLEWQSGFFLEGRYIAGSNPSDDGLGIANIGFRF